MSSTRIEPYVRTEMVGASPPPASTVGIIGWMRANLFSGPLNTILTLIGLYIIYLLVPPVIEFAFTHAIWHGSDGAACRHTNNSGGLVPVGEPLGACWPYVSAYLDQFIYGKYPEALRWRVNVCYFLGAALLIPMLMPKAPYKKWNAIALLGAYPLITLILLTGGHFDIATATWIFWAVIFAVAAGAVAYISTISDDVSLKGGLTVIAVAAAVVFGTLALLSVNWGLRWVETSNWGGLLVTLVVAVTGIVASLPLGILLALGRRSNMPVVKLFSIIFIEFWRGVPLITVLFMSSVMLPLFLPEGVNFDKLLRCLIGVALFSAAYMAETIRGGLQAIPKGQYEGAMALGLSYWRMMGLIVLPQALKLVIPGIVNSFISLFKDTTLVLIIGLFDLLGQIQSSFTDPNWASPVTSHTGYMIAAITFWIFCFGMSRYSVFMENLLHTGHKR